MSIRALYSVCICTILFCVIQSKKLEVATLENCEVCVTFMTRFIDGLDSDTKSDQKAIEEAFRKECKHTKKSDNRFCYYLGGLEESATGTVQDLSKPLSWGVPAEKICIKLYRKDNQICDLKYEKKMDLSAVDFKKLKVKDLKAILSEWNQQCKGCTEKSDFIRLIQDLLPKYDPEAYAKRQKSEL